MAGWTPEEAEANWRTSDAIDAGVHVGGYLAAADREYVRRHGFTHILKLFADDPALPGGAVRHPGIRYFVLPAEDEEGFPLARYFPACLAFIGQALEGGGKVLIHCHMGVSRAPSVALAYLIRLRGLSLDEAWRVVKSRRRQASPNSSFRRQLECFAARG